MNKFYIFLVALFMSGLAFGQIYESFETGLPTSYSNTTSFTLASGAWTGSSSQVIRGTTGVTQGLYSLQLRSRTGSQITSPTLIGGVGTISFNLSASTASGGLQVRISSNDGANWTQVTGSPVSFGTTITSQTFTINDADINRVQFYRTGSTVYIDEVNITTFSSPTDPTITVSQTSITDLDYLEGNGPSTGQTFDITGANLDGSDVTVSLPLASDFEISETSSGANSNSITLPAFDGTSTTIYVRLKAGLSINTYIENITIAGGGADSVLLALSGEVIVPSYCNAGPTSSNDSEIENVTLIGENNSIGNNTTENCTGQTGGFINDFTAQSADLAQGGSYSLNVEFGDCDGGSQYNGAGGVWIDWSNDFDFDDVGEKIGTANVAVGSGNVIENFLINVPVGQAIGTYRMRIVQLEGGNTTSISPCGIFTRGSVEDYTIEVIAASPSCALVSLGLENISCNDNDTPEDASDDITSFELNPTGNNLGSTYSVDMDGFANISTSMNGPFTSDIASGINYGTPTTFYLEPGSAGIGATLDALIIDSGDNSCFDIASITDPGSCSSGSETSNCALEIDFESAEGYTSSITEFTDNSGDYFTQTDGSNISATFSNTDGSYFASQDIDGEGASLPVSISMTNIDISSLTNLEFSIDLAEDGNSGSDHWDSSDYVRVFYSIDSGPEQNLIWIQNDGTSFNSAPLIDSDFDGIGDGTEITDAFTTFIESITSTGNTMNIRIEFNLNAGDEDIAIDNIKVCGNETSPITYTFNGTWSPSDPNGTSTASENIVIASGDASISQNTTANSVIVNPGASLTVDAVSTLTVADNLTLQSNSSSYSSLILDGSITGTVNYERFVNVMGTSEGGGNDLITPPLNGQRFDNFALANQGVLAASGDLRAFAPFKNDANPGVYVNYDVVNNAATILEAGAGYRAAAGDVLKFTGTANTTDMSIGISAAAGTYGEWNLIGNPYPSYLDIDAFLRHDASPGTQNIQLLDNASGIYGYTANNLDRWKIITLSNSADQLMTPGQGFFVASGSAGGYLKFTPAMRSSAGGDDFIPNRSTAIVYLKLQAATNTKSYTTDFYFNENSSLGLDAGYDAKTWGGQSSGFILTSALGHPS